MAIPSNHGASVPDLIAIGNEHEDIEQWRKRCNVDMASQIRLVKLSHMRYQHPDLDQITTFLQGEPHCSPSYESQDSSSLQTLE